MRSKKLLSIFASIMLVIGLMPTPALAGQKSASAGNDDTQTYGTAGVDYVDGQVLVAVRGGQEALDAELAENSAHAFGLDALGLFTSTPYAVEESLSSVSVQDLVQAAEDTGATEEYGLNAASDNLSSLSVDEDEVEILLLNCDDVPAAISDLLALDCVLVAQPNYCYRLSDDDETARASQTDAQTEDIASADADALSTDGGAAPLSSAALDTASTDKQTGADEPFYSGQWSLQSSTSLEENGYTSASASNASMDVEEVWTQFGAGNEENGDVVVAVIDCGVDYTHEDLAANMWDEGLNYPALTALGGGKYGYNCTSAGGDRSDPMDYTCGHGTHVATTIAAAWNNIGIAGINNQAKIMGVHAIAGDSSEITTAGDILAYNYVITAKENGVNVVAANNSYGTGFDTDMQDSLLDALILKAGKLGVISVFSAGNSNIDNDLYPGQQLNNQNPYLVVVGALTSEGEAACFSQWGINSVDLYSPGTQVLAGVTTQGVKNDYATEYEPQYLPWLKGSSGAQSSYFLDDAGDNSRPTGISYDLVSYDSNFTFQTVSAAESYDAGYPNKGVNNNKSYKFSLAGIDNSAGDQNIAIRVTISAEKWAEIVEQSKGDDLFIAATDGVSNNDIARHVEPWVIQEDGWNSLGWAGNFYDVTWNACSFQNSLSALNQGKDDNGDVHILLTLDGMSQREFTAEDYVYFDNFSLGWSACTAGSTEDSIDAYYYLCGTSMSAPNTTGVVSLLCSHAKAVSDDADSYVQDAETAKEIVSFIKGGVTHLDSLSDLCSTGGTTDASTSYAAYSAYKQAANNEERLAATKSLQPVIDSVTENADGTCTLNGSFFGEEKGSVTFDGTELDVVEGGWTDTAITFNPSIYSKERIGMVKVTKPVDDTAVKWGQGSVTMPAGSSSAATFDTLPNPDFTITYTDTAYDGFETTIEANAKDVVPEKMAAAAGYIYVLGTLADKQMPVLLRYDRANQTWDEQNYLADYAISLADYYLKYEASMVAGVSEIYVKLVDANDWSNKLLTIDAATGAVKHFVTLDPANSGSTLAFCDDTLFLVGGYAGDPVCSAVYPDTGELYWSSDTMLEKDACYGTATYTGYGFLLTGSFGVAAADIGEYEPGQRNQEIYIVIDEEGNATYAESSAIFFPTKDADSSYALDSGQGFAWVSAAAVDGGVLVTGPVRNNTAINMVDTWCYSLESDSWKPILTARFADSAEADLCACTYDGIYYVMATDMNTEETYQRFACYSLENWGMSDSEVAATKNAVTSDDPTPEPKPHEAFTDLDPDAWYLQPSAAFADGTLYLDFVLERGIMNGYTDTTEFGPSNPVTRSQFATMLYRYACSQDATLEAAYGSTTNPENFAETNTTKLSDVKAGEYYTAAVNWAVENGVITGYRRDDGTYATFGPEDKISREQLATMVYRYCSTQLGIGGGTTFRFNDDAAISDWAREGVYFCYAKGIVSGVGGTGNFDPQGNAQRCEAAKMTAIMVHDVAEG